MWNIMRERVEGKACKKERVCACMCVSELVRGGERERVRER